MSLRDNYFRLIDYMRVSITDRCNLRCVYCMPPEGVEHIVHKDILSYEEIVRIVRISAELGVRKVRITGGEPLARKNVQFLLREISSIDGIDDLSLTTNGVLLDTYAEELKECGLRRINVSLDTMKHERYSEITRGGKLEAVLRGMEKACSLGLVPLKLNMVPMRGVNDDEILDFARLTLHTPYHVRFIELMPIGNSRLFGEDRHVPTNEVMGIVERIGKLTPVKVRKCGPARYYNLPGSKGVVGFISAMTHHFCSDCNRLRLTPDGKLRPCLFSETEIDLKTPLRKGCHDDEIKRLLQLAIEVKPEGGQMMSKAVKRRSMSSIGG